MAGLRPRPTALVAGALLAGGLGAAAGAPAAAETIGRALVVRSVVEALEAGGPRQVVRNDPLVEGLRLRLPRRDSLLRVGFNAGGMRTYTPGARLDGVFVLQGPSEAVPGRPSTLSLLYGRLLAVLSPGRSAEVTTPETSLGMKGTVIRVLVDPVVGTFVAADEGAVLVQALAGGDPVLVTAGRWVVVPPGGLPTSPAPRETEGEVLDDPALLQCCAGTEPPKPPVPR
jgi:hypothetical protein